VNRSSRLLTSFVAPLLAIIISFAIASAVLLLVDIDPLGAYGEMWAFGTTTESLISMINRAIPLFVSALAVAVGFKMGLFNIGVEGAYLLTALIAGYLAALIALPSVLHVFAILLIAALIGGVWNGLAGWLKVKRGVHEVISTIMLNFIAFSLNAWLFLNYLKADIGGLTTATALIPESGWIPSLNFALGWFGVEPRAGTELHGFLVIAIFLGVFYHFLVNRSRFGYDLRASGINPSAAHASGVNPKRMIVTTMVISGSIAGLVGMSTLLGFSHRYVQDFPSGLGFAGIAVALLGRNNPVGMAFGAVLFGFLERSSIILDLKDVPREIVTIFQGVIVLAVVIVYEVVSRYAQRRAIAAAAQATADLEVAVMA